MTVLFKNLRAGGYGERTTLTAASRTQEVTVSNTLVYSCRASIGWWRAWDRKLLCKPIPAHYTMSVIAPARVERADGSLVSFTTFSLVVPSFTIAVLVIL